MLTQDFDFDLPEERIAQVARPRGTSRLFVLDAEGEKRHRHVGDLAELLRPGDLLVLNDTRVIPARLYGRRPSGGRSELLLIEKLGPARWAALTRPAKKMRPGTIVRIEPATIEPATIEPATIEPVSSTAHDLEVSAEVIQQLEPGKVEVLFNREIEPILGELGHVPLPPYIRRPDEEADRDRYQTVYAQADGAVAAPTAGLHFDDALLASLEKAGIARTTLTLHVGIGTFKGVSAEKVSDHRMDEERYVVPAEATQAIRRTRERGGRVVAVGTTVVRTLESVARTDGTVEAGAGRTRIFITPGFSFRAADVLLTNFHLPRSTLLMLVSAFAGRERVLDAYREAVEREYRFYSYGDAMLLERRD